MVLERFSVRPLAGLFDTSAGLWRCLGDALRQRDARLDPCYPILPRDYFIAVCLRSRCILAMTDILVQIIFGWPAIITSILLSIAGVWWKKPALLIAAGIVCIPFTYYLSGIRLYALILPLFQFGSAYAVMRQQNLIAWLLIAPLIIVAILLAYAVLTQ